MRFDSWKVSSLIRKLKLTFIPFSLFFMKFSGINYLLYNICQFNHFQVYSFLKSKFFFAQSVFTVKIETLLIKHNSTSIVSTLLSPKLSFFQVLPPSGFTEHLPSGDSFVTVAFRFVMFIQSYRETTSQEKKKRKEREKKKLIIFCQRISHIYLKDLNCGIPQQGSSVSTCVAMEVCSTIHVCDLD